MKATSSASRTVLQPGALIPMPGMDLNPYSPDHVASAVTVPYSYTVYVCN